MAGSKKRAAVALSALAGTVGAVALSRCLGLSSERELSAWLAERGLKPTRYRGGERFFRWSQLQPLLTPTQLRAALRVCEKKRPSPGNSKYWVSGYPRLVAEWHPFKNDPWRPDQITYGSPRYFWWKCPKGPDHEWRASVVNRVGNRTGCPFCRGYRVSVTNSLATRYPALAAQWHPTENGNLTPADLTHGSSRQVWWKCDRGPDHEWQESVASRTPRRGCPFCAGMRVSVTNSLATVAPTVAAQWHPAKNGSRTPESVVAKSAKTVWWKCHKGADHEWRASVYSRVQGIGCPACSHKRVSVTNSLQTLYPEIAAQWHPTRNGRLTPDKTIAGSTSEVWWKCPLAPDHLWKASPYYRTHGGKQKRCPFCAGHRPSISNSLRARFPALAEEWHPTKNGSLRPENIASGTGQFAWWRCKTNPAHEWQATIVNRTHLGTGCPFCAGKKADSSNSLAALQPRLARQWHKALNAPLTPADVTPGSSKRVWWQCPIGRDHLWEATVESRAGIRQTGCPYCAGRKLSVSNSLAAVAPELAKQWHRQRNGSLSPKDVLAGSTGKAWWQCPDNPWHLWRASILSRTRGSGCPFCGRARSGRKPKAQSSARPQPIS